LVLMSIERGGLPKAFMVTEVCVIYFICVSICVSWEWRDLVLYIPFVYSDSNILTIQAGIIGKIGFNSSSVGVCLNAIRAKVADPSKLPIHLALRICLSSTSAAAAISKLESLGGIASSAHILIADPSGPKGLELSPLGNAYLDPDSRGMVFHTNHFICNKCVKETGWLSRSPVRLARVKELAREMDQKGERVDGEILRKRIFADELNAPQSICAKEDENLPVQSRMRTLFSIAMWFGEGTEPKGEVVLGRPGSGEEGPAIDMPW